MPKIRRKRYVIAARFQIKYILYILLFLYVGAAIAGYTVYFSTWTTLGEKLAGVYPRGRLMFIFKQSNLILMVRLLLVSPIFIVIGVILSHRVAGPIYRIGKYIETLMLGDYSRGLALRKNDEFKPLAVKMTELCKKLKDDDMERKKIAFEIQDVLKESKVSSEVVEKVKGMLGEIVEKPSGSSGKDNSFGA
jgi:methyl-accepting chemotaxis protein